VLTSIQLTQQQQQQQQHTYTPTMINRSRSVSYKRSKFYTRDEHGQFAKPIFNFESLPIELQERILVDVTARGYWWTADKQHTEGGVRQTP